MIDFQDTIKLIRTVENYKPPAQFLTDTFFPNVLPVSSTKVVAMEYRETGRQLAPYIVPGTSGVNIARNGSIIRYYSPAMVAPRRVVSIEDIEQRAFGEDLLGSENAEARANSIQAYDLKELITTIQNRKNQMASEILTTGKVTINGYADDGRFRLIDTVDFGWKGKFIPETPWNNANSDPYSDIKKMSEWIQERIGTIPTAMIVGRNVANYLNANKKIKEWLSIPNRENFALMSVQPKLESPQIMRIGLLQSLNLEIYSYSETYTDDEGVLQQFFPSDGVLIAVPKFGSQLHGAVTILNPDGKFQTISAQFVPVYNADPMSQVMTLTLFSRFILVPTIRDSFAYMNVLDQNESETSLPGI